MNFLGCEDFLSQTKWDCNTYKYYFQERNFMHTLHCLAYDQDTLPNSPVNVKLSRKIKRVLKIDDDQKSLSLEESIQIEFIDPRLNFNDCQNEFRYSSEAAKYLWKPEFETFDGTSYNPKLEIAKLSKVSIFFCQAKCGQKYMKKMISDLSCQYNFQWKTLFFTFCIACSFLDFNIEIRIFRIFFKFKM